MPLTRDQLADIEAARASPRPTLRAVSPGMEARLYEPVPVLDHGFVRVVDYMGDDAAIVQAARVSYGAGTKKARDDSGLIRYLMRHRHSTPFEMCEIKLHVKLPLFVARQWIRHRTANVNEYSARYSILDREFYVPAPEHLAAQSAVNNQGRGAALEGAEAARVLQTLKADAARAYDHYEAMLGQDGQQGLPRELAPMNLPAHIHTQRYWKVEWHRSRRCSAMPIEIGKKALDAATALTEAVAKTSGGKDAQDELGKSAHTLTKFINNTLLPIAAVNFAFDKARKYFNERFPSDLAEAAKEIPSDKLKEPKASIAGPALQGLAYSHEEQSLKQLWLNLLRSAMDQRLEGADHPAFVEIIRQLTSVEAELLLIILQETITLPIARIVRKFPDGKGEITLERNIIHYHNRTTRKPIEIPNFAAMFDNWVRLGLIEVSFERELVEKSMYDWVKLRPEYLKHSRIDFGEENKIGIKRGIYNVSDFGRLFYKAIA